MTVERTADPVVCERCGQKLADDNQVWLELSTGTGRYAPEGQRVLPAESQGFFPFGYDCAAAIAKANGKNRRIMRAAR
jgi:hypothetical protein